MFLLFIVLAFPFDQADIDSAMTILRSRYYGNMRFENVQSRVPAFCGPGGMGEFSHEISSRDDIVIGDVPAETLAVTGYFFHSGNIIIINDG